MQAMYMESSGRSVRPASSYTDAYGNPLIVPAGFCQQAAATTAAAAMLRWLHGCNGGCYGGCNGCNGGGDCGPAGPGGGSRSGMADSMAACPWAAGGTDPPIGYDLMNDVGMEGDLADQRGPHYFDIRVEAVYLHRDKTFERRHRLDVAQRR